MIELSKTQNENPLPSKSSVFLKWMLWYDCLGVSIQCSALRCVDYTLRWTALTALLNCHTQPNVRARHLSKTLQRERGTGETETNIDGCCWFCSPLRTFTTSLKAFGHRIVCEHEITLNHNEDACVWVRERKRKAGWICGANLINGKNLIEQAEWKINTTQRFGI